MMDLKLEDKIVSNLNNLFNKNSAVDQPKNAFNLFMPTEDYAYSVVLPYLKNTFELSFTENLKILERWIFDNYKDGNMPRLLDEIELTEDMDDPQPILKGTRGTVTGYESLNMWNEDHMLVDWDNGRSLKLIVGVDKFRRI